MERTILRKISTDLVERHYPKSGDGCRPYPLEVRLRVHVMQPWFNPSGSDMEETRYDSTAIRDVLDIDMYHDCDSAIMVRKIV